MSTSLLHLGHWLCLTALALAAPLGEAASFSVSPLRVELAPGHASQALTVRNDNLHDAVVVQAQVLAWRQDGGTDQHSPTRDVLATPPIFTIPPGAAQIVRVAFRSPPGGAHENAFRLLLREVPASPAATDGVRIAVELSLPVFVKPHPSVAPALAWRLQRDAGDGLRLRVENGGSAHVQLANLALHADGEAGVIAQQEGFAYVLPAQGRDWLLAPKPGKRLGGAGNVRLKAWSDAGPIDTPLLIDAP